LFCDLVVLLYHEFSVREVVEHVADLYRHIFVYFPHETTKLSFIELTFCNLLEIVATCDELAILWKALELKDSRKSS
jgi:hypothetical protein